MGTPASTKTQSELAVTSAPGGASGVGGAPGGEGGGKGGGESVVSAAATVSTTTPATSAPPSPTAAAEAVAPTATPAMRAGDQMLAFTSALATPLAGGGAGLGGSNRGSSSLGSSSLGGSGGSGSSSVSPSSPTRARLRPRRSPSQLADSTPERKSSYAEGMALSPNPTRATPGYAPRPMLPSAGTFFLAFWLLVFLECAYWAYRRDLGIERRVDRGVISCS